MVTAEGQYRVALTSPQRPQHLATMIRSEFIARIAAQNPHLRAKDVEAMVGAIIDRIAEALADGDRVELRGFGVFEVRQREPRTARNPRSGEAVEVKARTHAHFKPGKTIQVRLNRVLTYPKPRAGGISGPRPYRAAPH